MSLSPSASWRSRSTPPTRCGCPSGKPSGSFSSWPSERSIEPRVGGGRVREERRRRRRKKNRSRGGKCTGAMPTFLQWHLKSAMGSGEEDSQCRHFFFAILRTHRKRKYFINTTKSRIPLSWLLPFSKISLCQFSKSLAAHSKTAGGHPDSLSCFLATFVSSSFYFDFWKIEEKNSLKENMP